MPPPTTPGTPRSGVSAYFHLLVAGQAVSWFGSFLNMVALNLFAYQLTGSALRTGLFMALRLASSFVAGPLAGNAVARYNRRALMIASDLTQALGLTVLVLAPSAAQERLLYGLAVLAGTCTTLSTVALRSSVPEIVGQDARVRANGLLVTGRSLAMVLGFAAAGTLVAWSGYRAAFVVDGATFLVSALNLAWLPLTLRAPARPAAPAGDGVAGDGVVGDGAAPDGPAGLRRSQRQLAALLKAAPVLFVVILIRAVDGFGSASHNVGIPVYANIVSPANPAAFMGHFWAAWALGNLLAYHALIRLLRGSGHVASESAFAVGTCLMSTLFILVFAGLPAPLLLLVACGAGVADGFTEIAYTSRLQAVADDQRGALFGLSAMAESSGFGIGMVVSAWLLERLSPLTVVGLAHGTAIAMALTFLLFLLFVLGRAPRPQPRLAEQDMASSEGQGP